MQPSENIIRNEIGFKIWRTFIALILWLPMTALMLFASCIFAAPFIGIVMGLWYLINFDFDEAKEAIVFGMFGFWMPAVSLYEYIQTGELDDW